MASLGEYAQVSLEAYLVTKISNFRQRASSPDSIRFLGASSTCFIEQSLKIKSMRCIHLELPNQPRWWYSSCWIEILLGIRFGVFKGTLEILLVLIYQYADILIVKYFLSLFARVAFWRLAGVMPPTWWLSLHIFDLLNLLVHWFFVQTDSLADYAVLWKLLTCVDPLLGLSLKGHAS